MLSKSLSVSVSCLFVLALGCSSESATPAGTGGSTTTGNGGATTGNGGTTVTGSGGATVTGNGGATVTGTGGATTGSGGATTGSGGATTGSGGATTGSGGATTGSGGATTGSGGATTAGAAGTATASGGSTAGASATGCSDGCAQLSVPFTQYTVTNADASKTYFGQQFEIYIGDDMTGMDLTGATISVKIRKIAGKAGGFQIFAKGVMPNNYASAYNDPWFGIDGDLTTDWKTVTLDLTAATGTHKDDMFSPATVHILAVQLSSGDPWYSDDAKTMVDLTALINPTVVQIDSITISGGTATVGPYNFTADVADFHLGTYQPITGSTVTWVGP
jgi:hypothetical protein